MSNYKNKEEEKEKKQEVTEVGTWALEMKAGGIGGIVPQDFAAVWRLANVIGLSGMAPRDFNTRDKVAVAIMHGMEVGLSPMAAMQSIAVVNGRPSLWGDAVLGLVRSSGLLESFKEEIIGEGDNMKAVCTVKRKDDTENIVSEFSVDDAKKANLWNKSGPWTQYPKRMLKLRARGFALRDGFPDVLRGLHVAEEQRDIEVSQNVIVETPPSPPKPQNEKTEDAQIIDMTPPSPGEVEDDASFSKYGAFDSLGEYLEGLQIALAGCENADEVESLWSEFDPMATLEGDDHSQTLAINMKEGALDKLMDRSEEDSGGLFQD